MGRDFDPDEEAEIEKKHDEFVLRARSMLLQRTSCAGDKALQVRHRENALRAAQRIIACVERRDAQLAAELTLLLSTPSRSIHGHGNYVPEGSESLHGRG